MSKQYQQKVVYKTAPTFVKLTDIKPGKHGYTVYAKVIECKHEQVKRNDGSLLDICEATLGDDTATINARIVGKFATVLQKGKVVAIRNGRSEVNQEHHRLEIDAFGKISEEDSQEIKKIGDRQMSAIVYETRIIKKQ